MEISLMYANRITDSRAVAQASQMEHQILDHVKQALRITLDWKAPSVSLPRKMSSVQFTMKSFARHLLRMMDLEERDGYMAVVVEEKPNLDTRIKRLQRDHRAFRQRLDELAPEIAALHGACRGPVRVRLQPDRGAARSRRPARRRGNRAAAGHADAATRAAREAEASSVLGRGYWACFAIAAGCGETCASRQADRLAAYAGCVPAGIGQLCGDLRLALAAGGSAK